MGGIRAWFAEHVTAADAVAAAGLAALSVPATFGGDAAAGVLAPGTGVAGFGWLWFAAVHAPLAWRRRAPAATLWTVIALVLCCAAAGVTGVFLIFVVITAVYTVARHASARALLFATAAATGLLGLAWLREPGEWPAVLAALCLVVAAASGGAGLAARHRLAAERERHRRQRLELDAKAAVAAERARLAREVHDVVGHNLAVMVALADGAAATIASQPERAEDMLDKAATAGREALGELRRVVKLLRDGDGDAPTPTDVDAGDGAQALAAGVPMSPTASVPALALDGHSGSPALSRVGPAQPSGDRCGGTDGHFAPAGPGTGTGRGSAAAASCRPLADELGRLAERVRLAGLELDLVVAPDGPEPPCGVAASALRVVQESVTNVLKHAGPAARAQILVRLEPAAVDITVSDDGAASAAAADRDGPPAPGPGPAAGHGLTGLAERVAVGGGSFTACPASGGGWRVHARIPHGTKESADQGRSEPT